MVLRHHRRRLLDQRGSHARRAQKQKRNKCRPAVESLEPRNLMTGTWQTLQTTNPVGAPPAGTQTFMLLSDGTVMEAGFTQPGSATGSTNWFPLRPDQAGSYINGNWGAPTTMNTARLFFPTAL